MTFVPRTAACLSSRDERNDAESETFVVSHGSDAGVLSPTPRAMGHDGSHANGGGQVAVAYAANDYAAGTFEKCDTARPLTTSQDRSRAAPLSVGQGVRRLTPRECERLMSWPDDWTRWDDEGREIADGPRYRMCGNGMVSNCVEWIGRRILTHG